MVIYECDICGAQIKGEWHFGWDLPNTWTGLEGETQAQITEMLLDEELLDDGGTQPRHFCSPHCYAMWRKHRAYQPKKQAAEKEADDAENRD